MIVQEGWETSPVYNILAGFAMANLFTTAIVVQCETTTQPSEKFPQYAIS